VRTALLLSLTLLGCVPAVDWAKCGLTEVGSTAQKGPAIVHSAMALANAPAPADEIAGVLEGLSILLQLSTEFTGCVVNAAAAAQPQPAAAEKLRAVRRNLNVPSH